MYGRPLRASLHTGRPLPPTRGGVRQLAAQSLGAAVLVSAGIAAELTTVPAMAAALSINSTATASLTTQSPLLAAVSSRVAVSANLSTFASLQAQILVVGTVTPALAASGDGVQPPATGGNLYVLPSATGNGLGGDWANALAANTFTPIRNRRYYWGGGNYGTARTWNTAASGSQWIVFQKATAADHGTDTGWQASYGTTQGSWTGNMQFNSPYWWIDGRTGGGAIENWGGNYGFLITNTSADRGPISFESTTSNIVLRHLDLQGMNSAGTNGGNAGNDGIAGGRAICTDLTVSYCRIDKMGRCPIWGQAKGTWIYEHTFFGRYNYGSGVHAEVNSCYGQVDDTSVVGSVIVRWCMITHIQSTGGFMWAGDFDNTAGTNPTNPNGLTVYGSVFYQPATNLWVNDSNGLIGGWTGFTYRNAKIFHNTFYRLNGNAGMGVFSDTGASGNQNNNLANNLFVDVSSDFGYGDYSNSGCSHNYNHYSNSGGTQGEANSTSGTVTFVDPTNYNFKPTANTAAGTVLPPPYNTAPYNVDALGKTRSTTTRGAFEF